VPIAEPHQLDQTFHALADSNRRAIVARLTSGTASVSELAAPLDVSLPTVLQHLDVLQRSGLVRSEKVGRVRTCRLEPGPMHALEHWIAEHRVIWERRLDLLGDVLEDAFPTTKGDRSK
jgi:DNA-binding transcriptional ArsR family regulator